MCFYFDIQYTYEYEKVTEKLIDAINTNKEIENFIKSVKFIEFVGSLGKIIQKMDNLAHSLFPELSIKYRTQYNTENYNKETSKKNITKCMEAYGEYVKDNFDLLTNFFNDYYDYPKYMIYNKNHEQGDKKYLFNAIKKYTNKNIN